MLKFYKIKHGSTRPNKKSTPFHLKQTIIILFFSYLSKTYGYYPEQRYYYAMFFIYLSRLEI
jgi:hypothetical protein